MRGEEVEKGHKKGSRKRKRLEDSVGLDVKQGHGKREVDC